MEDETCGTSSTGAAQLRNSIVDAMIFVVIELSAMKKSSIASFTKLESDIWCRTRVSPKRYALKEVMTDESPKMAFS